MRYVLFALALLGLPLQLHAEQLRDSTGVIVSAQTATGASTDTVVTSGASALYIDYTLSAGTATMTIEQQGHPDAAYRVVTGSSQTASSLIRIDTPIGLYRSNVTACAGCNVTVRYQLVHHR